MGSTGVRSLVSRALMMARDEADSLRAVQVGADGSLEAALADPAEIAAGGVVLVAQLLGLLAAFVGENVTLGLVREVWPKLALRDWHTDKREDHEKPK